MLLQPQSGDSMWPLKQAWIAAVGLRKTQICGMNSLSFALRNPAERGYRA
jgi:hypothetical protein